MLQGSSKEILDMVKKAENKKSLLEQTLKDYESKKINDNLMMHSKELAGMQNNRSSFLKEIYDDKKTLMDDDHEIAEIKREIAGVDKKIREIKHWTGQLEYEDELKNREVVENAGNILQSI